MISLCGSKSPVHVSHTFLAGRCPLVAYGDSSEDDDLVGLVACNNRLRSHGKDQLPYELTSKIGSLSMVSMCVTTFATVVRLRVPTAVLLGHASAQALRFVFPTEMRLAAYAACFGVFMKMVQTNPQQEALCRVLIVRRSLTPSSALFNHQYGQDENSPASKLLNTRQKGNASEQSQRYEMSTRCSRFTRSSNHC